MRAMVYAGPEDLQLTELDDPELGPRDIRVRIEACGICGSDVASYLHGHYAAPGQVLGHEMSSVVEQLGSELSGVKPGDRVAIRTARSCGDCVYCDAGRPYLCDDSGRLSIGYGARGGFADLMTVRDVVIGDDVVPVPADVSADDMMWTEPLSVALHAVRRAGINVDSGATLVVGAGSVGLCVIAAAIAEGATDLVAVEPRADRRQAASTLGARTLDPGQLESASGQQFTHIIDTSGSLGALTAALPHLRVGGRLTLVGLGEGRVPWPIPGIELVTSFAFDEKDFRAAVDHIVSGRVRLAGLISHRYDLAGAGEAIEASARDPRVIKAAVYPGAGHSDLDAEPESVTS
ncbi:sorbitol dehydrogenase [Nocardioides flavus (ex Wang et al. 2016)]|uniref:Sorbitol dehydrogenase n=1 Tax=Nocardioides flavus (ex Wang et al. 2016) TaxID=2058780 RepID=A0ABQ3HJD5_9ACTN|nr:alcohol dehydrogenase catalytic domain-containing protein [Nocardioides flavus (ex Wang et al. 2016)]GHE16764.1 sorbitol dehydrogenase [Nocardioides flavus (ex Wang et al. 2016)]